MEPTVNIEQINLPDGTTSVEVRTGGLPAPLPLRDIVPVNLDGNLDSVELFLSSRKEMFITNEGLAKRSHVLVDTDRGTLQLVVDESSYYASKVKGTLTYNPYLADFGINKESQKYTVQQLIDKFKLLRYFFASVDQNIKIISELRKFSASVVTNIDQHADGKGNSRNLNEKFINTDFNFSFQLNIPIYKVGSKAVFEVDICPDATDAGIKFTLQSPELFELEQIHRQAELDKALTMATELGITIISK